MQHLPIGTSTFPDIITGQMLYIDKTAHIYPLLQRPKGAYFLSRPRRFGKSLLLSTLKAIFEGRRELFTELWLGKNTAYAFESYPIFHLDMSNKKIYHRQDVEDFVIQVTNEVAQRYEIVLQNKTYETRFGELLVKLSVINQVVILIDEYDKPILDNLTHDKCHEIKEALKGFYSVIKGHDAYVRFVLLTGITQFSKISVFSGLNNLQDLTMHDKFAPLLGITQDELEFYLGDRLAQLADKEQLNLKQLLEKIKFWYNGYRFTIAPIQLYNPFSTLLLLDEQRFKFFWFETGTPTFLIELIKQKQWEQLPEEKIVSETAFSSYEIENLQPLPLLFQSGYLTIQDVYTTQETLYKLDFPNFEVKNGFLAELVRSFSNLDSSDNYIFRLVRYFNQGNIHEVLEELKIFFANIPYDIQIKREKYYQTLFFAVFELLGFQINAEVRTNRGRVDAIVETAQAIYIFEFKLYGSKEAALAQIKQLNYAEKFLSHTKPILLIGVEFNETLRNIGDWLIEPMT